MKRTDNRTPEGKERSKKGSSIYMKKLMADPVRKAERQAKMLASRMASFEQLRLLKRIMLPPTT